MAANEPAQEKQQINTDEADIQTVKYFSPIRVDHYVLDWETGVSEYPIELDGYYSAEYESVISKGIETENGYFDSDRGLMEYYYEDDSVSEKVLSAYPAVEEYDNTLWGVMECKIRGKLTYAEKESLMDYFTGQYADGWGEGFEQRDLEIGDGSYINVHFWQWKGFFIQDEQKLKNQHVRKVSISRETHAIMR